MLTLERITAGNEELHELIALLDAELAALDGEDHPFYAQYNKLAGIHHIVLARWNGKAAGCGALKELAAGCMEVKRMYVSEELRGRGIAAAVLAELEQWAHEGGYTCCMLETGYKQQSAVRLYQRCGYTVIQNYGQYAGVENSICMKKVLVAASK